DARLVIEPGMHEVGLLRERVAAQVQTHARVPLVPVPVTPVAGERADLGRDLLRRRLDLLQAKDVGLLAREPVEHLPVPRADPVHVPGGNLEAHFALGPVMSSGRTHWSNCSAVRKPSLSAASFKVVPSWCAVLAIFAALS